MKKPADAKARRERSYLSEADCLEVFRQFSKRIVRFGETSEPSLFCGPSSSGKPGMARGHLNVQFMARGSFGVASDVFEAFRVLNGYKLPRIKPKTTLRCANCGELDFRDAGLGLGACQQCWMDSALGRDVAPRADGG